MTHCDKESFYNNRVRSLHLLANQPRYLNFQSIFDQNFVNFENLKSIQFEGFDKHLDISHQLLKILPNIEELKLLGFRSMGITQNEEILPNLKSLSLPFHRAIPAHMHLIKKFGPQLA